MKKHILIIIIIFVALFAARVYFADAQETVTSQYLEQTKITEADAADLGLMSGTSEFCYSKGDCSVCDFIVVINNIGFLLRNLLGSVALLMFIIGGAYWLFSGGVAARVENGKKIITGSIVGIVIFLGAFTIINYVLYGLVTGSPGSESQLGKYNIEGSQTNLWYNFQCKPALTKEEIEKIEKEKKGEE